MSFPAARRTALTSVGLLLVFASLGRAQTSDNVLLVVNEASPASIQVAQYYAQKRSLAADHVIRIKTVTTDSVERAEYLRSIETPIGAWLSKHSLQDKILFIVLTKGVPLRISGSTGRDGTIASVDSELTLLYRKLAGSQSPLGGRVPNPYFLGDKPPLDAKPFTRFLSDIYLVTRLDGFTVPDVLKLIDRGLTPSRTGKIVLDQKAALVDRGGNAWLQEASDRLRSASAADRVVLETTTAAPPAAGPLLGYYSWGSNDPARQWRRSGLEFAPGAIGGMFVSTDGRTFTEPPAGWMPSGPNGGPSYGGSFQSLAGDLIRDGITGVSAHVAEPYLDATIRPQILFPAYVAGFTLAESFYLAMPYLSWQTVIVGDPLCAPFSRRPLSPEQLYQGIDADTELPALFAARKMAGVAGLGLNREGLKLSLKADVHLARGNRGEAEALWQRATELEPRLVVAQLSLAALYEQRAEYDKAIDRYRRVLATDAQNILVLNNLAYALAERQHAPKEALPFAEKAYRLAPDPAIADTLAWIRHLLGDDRSAALLVERALAGARDNADIQFHAAVIHSALNDRAKARAELDLALKLDPRLESRAEVKALRDQLKGG